MDHKAKGIARGAYQKVGRMSRQGTLPNSCIEKGKIHVNRLDPQIPEDIDTLTLDIYKQMPPVSITEYFTRS